MVYRPKVDEKLCFVLMPFGAPFDSYYKEIIGPAASDAGLATLRSDEIYSNKEIIADIWTRIWAARVVVAEVSGRNANVNYELGLCHALGVPTITVSGNVRDLPFDYTHRRSILYDVTQPAWAGKLRDDLVKTIRTVLAENSDDNGLMWPYDTSILKGPVPSGVLVGTADSRKIVIRGANAVRDALARAFGPYGSSVSISRTFGGTIESRRGGQIAQGIKSSNPLEENGIAKIASATRLVTDAQGDCSKLVAILAAGFMAKGQELIDAGFRAKDVVQVFRECVDEVRSHLEGNKTNKMSSEGLLAVAKTAAAGDRRLGAMIVEAMKRAGREGVITIETTSQSITTLEFFEGFLFDRGYLSDYFITDPHNQECVLEDCLILLHQRPLHLTRDLLPVLEQVARSNSSLLVIADDVEAEALSTLVLNKVQGTLRCAAVKSPGIADRRRTMMEDIAILTGGKYLNDEMGIPLSNVKLAHLGRAKRVVITQNQTTIVGGGGTKAAIIDRMRFVQTQLDTASSDYDIAKLQERLAQLAGTAITLKVGGVREADVEQEKYLLTSALNSARSAIEFGAVLGGGVALLRAGMSLKSTPSIGFLFPEAVAAVAAVLEEPLYQLIENAQRSPTQIIEEIRESRDKNWGFNVETGKSESLLQAGILDAVNPIVFSLKVALSHASSVLETGTWDLSSPLAPSQAVPDH